VAKQLSGAAKRKRKREKDQAAQDATLKRRQQLVSVGQSWLSQPGYRGTLDEFDPKAPPVQIPIFGTPGPTFVPAVMNAVTQLEQGNFYQPAILYDFMMRDDRIQASLATRQSGLLGEPIKLDPADESDAALDIRDATEKKISKIFPTPQLAQLLRYAWGLSVGVAQVKTTKTVKSWTPTIEVWNPRFMWFDWLIRKYRMTTENKGTIVLDPEDPEWLIYEPYGPLGWLHGALLRPLALPWIMRYWTRTWWVRHQEVHGQPVRVGIIPADRTPQDERTFLAQIGNFAHEAVVRLVQGSDGNKFDLKLLESSSDNWEGFSKLIEHCDRSIEIAILGQSQSTEGQGGLGSQEKAGESTLMRLIRGDAQLGECLRDKVLTQDAEANYNNAELAPSLTWEVDPPEDLEKKAKAFQLVGLGLQQIALAPEASKLIDMRALLESFQVPLLAEEDVPETDPGEASPSPTPSEGDEENKGAKEPDVEGDESKQESKQG
jgi:Protein of unknown function (DUF935)